jgi:ubiquinone/menaquinone biosynthesis C-methylase UbiE
MNEKECGCTIEGCDIFDFMATHVGLTVIHPGGLEATQKLAKSCHLGEHTRVVDIACGKGTSAIYLAQRYGCEVTGIDISEDMVAQATALAKQKGVEEKVDLRVGDALELPFPDDEFDAAISQAMLVLVGDKRKAIQEALRVVKPGGYLGWLELSWKKQPTIEFLDAVSNVLCAYCMQNVHTFQGWEDLIREAGVSALETQSFSLGNAGMAGMLANEALWNTGKVMFKYITNVQIRKRMNTMNRFFRGHTEYFGYGIYTGRK